DVETTASIINGALSATDKVSLEVWGVKKELEVLQRTTHAQSIYSIMEDQERKRKAVLSQARRHEVEGRLRKLGWSDDDFHAMKNKLLWRAFLSIPEPLSEKGVWIATISHSSWSNSQTQHGKKYFLRWFIFWKITLGLNAPKKSNGKAKPFTPGYRRLVLE
ncbi:hypothetical protein FS749_012651, partial [Ceratobasidium sp. UAMH 11750]